MRKLTAFVIGFTLVSFSAVADEKSEHLEHLRMMVKEMSSHGPVIPQPESISTLDAKTIAIISKSFSFTPAQFTVNQGDVVTITVSTPANDQSRVGHGILMDQYIPQGIDSPRGGSGSFTFTATTPGTFAFICTQPSCGTGHTSMFGQMTVVAVANPAIASVAPNSGSTAGGTQITISGSGFVNGAAVTIGGVAATNVNVSSSTTITATTPLGPATDQLTVDVVVTNPNGTSATLTRGFSYTVPSLAVGTVSPSAGLIVGGTVVTISGAGFTTAVNSSVTFGGVPASNVSVVNPVTMQATTPAHAAGTVDVVVTMGNNSVSKAGAFIYQAVPPRHRAVRHPP